MVKSRALVRFSVRIHFRALVRSRISAKARNNIQGLVRDRFRVEVG
jgi:hypothetical protein